MKLVISFFIILLLSGCSSVPKKTKTSLRKHQVITLSNGLEVVFVEDQTLPSFNISLLVKVGGKYDTLPLSGLSYLTANLMKKGTANYSSLKFNELLASKGTQLDIDVNKDFTTISMKGLSFYQNQMIDLMAELLLQPSFKKSELVRLKKSQIAKAKKISDNPKSLIGKAFTEYLYSGHVYGRLPSGSVKSLKKVSRKQVVSHYRKYFRPNNAYLAVSGKFNKAETIAYLEKKLAQWKAQAIEKKSYPAITNSLGKKVLLVEKPSLKQAQVVLGQVAVSRNNPNYIKLRLAAIALGGGFSSRLFDEIRVNRGLTYGIYSYFRFYQEMGGFIIQSSTRNDKVGELVKVSLHILKDFIKNGMTKDELNLARSVLKGNFPRVLETSEGLAEQILMLKSYGVPDTYLSTFNQVIDSITLDEVNKAIREVLNEEFMKIVVYAPKAITLKQLEAIAPVEVKSYKDYLN